MTKLLSAIGLLLLMSADSVMAGSGHYWRLGVAGEDSRDATFLDRDCDPAGQAALFGCIDGQDGEAIGARGDFGRSLGIQLARGMHIGEAWRAELEVAYHHGFDFEGNANFLDAGEHQPVEASVSHARAGVNVYLDLAAAFARDAAAFEPYLGAGVNAVRNRLGTMTYSFPQLGNQPALTTVPGDSEIGLGWMVTLGTGIELSPRNLLDIGISWHDHGRVETAAGDIDIIRGGDTIARVGVGATGSRLETVGVMVAWRHYIR